MKTSCSLEKSCSKCKEVKHVSSFYRVRKGLNLMSQCKACQAKDYQDKREDRLRYDKQTYLSLQGRASHLRSAAKQRATAKGLDFDLSIEFVTRLLEAGLNKPCPLLGIEIKLIDSEGVKQPCSPSLDRIDNTRGYTEDNVWLVSWKANQIKNYASFEEFEHIYLNWKAKLHNTIV